MQEMQSKHPQAPAPSLPPGPAPPPASLPEFTIRKSVMSFPNGSAPGPSGRRPSHLREAVQCPSPDYANRLFLTRFVNLLTTGKAPHTINQRLCGATLLAIHKKNGGLRPIAVGEVLRRLVSKCLAIHIRFHPSTPTAGGWCSWRL